MPPFFLMTYDKKQRTIRMLALKSAIVTTAIHVNQTHWRFRPDEVRANDRFPPFAVIPLHLMFTTRAVSKQTESFSSRDPAVRPESVIRSDRIPL